MHICRHTCVAQNHWVTPVPQLKSRMGGGQGVTWRVPALLHICVLARPNTCSALFTQSPAPDEPKHTAHLRLQMSCHDAGCSGNGASGTASPTAFPRRMKNKRSKEAKSPATPLADPKESWLTCPHVSLSGSTLKHATYWRKKGQETKN